MPTSETRLRENRDDHALGPDVARSVLNNHSRIINAADRASRTNQTLGTRYGGRLLDP
jgi:hypothetical protein